MVKKISIGVIGVQGAVSEHIASMKNALRETKANGEVFVIKHKDEINEIDAILFPGGESTTISKILYKSGFHDAISKRIKENTLPIMGTCAGCVILASDLKDTKKDVTLLSAINMQVQRNAFGRQRESFEKYIDIKGFTDPYNAVFIRAPVINKVWGNCKVLAKVNNRIIMVKQGNILALSFHPELTGDLRVHRYFIDML